MQSEKIAKFAAMSKLKSQRESGNIHPTAVDVEDEELLKEETSKEDLKKTEKDVTKETRKKVKKKNKKCNNLQTKEASPPPNQIDQPSNGFEQNGHSSRSKDASPSRSSTDQPTNGYEPLDIEHLRNHLESFGTEDAEAREAITLAADKNVLARSESILIRLQKYVIEHHRRPHDAAIVICYPLSLIE